MYRQPGWSERASSRVVGDNTITGSSNLKDLHDHHQEGGVSPPIDSVSVRLPSHVHRIGGVGVRMRRAGRSEKTWFRLSSVRGFVFIIPSVILITFTFLAFSILSRDTKESEILYLQSDADNSNFFPNATKKNSVLKVLEFGQGSVSLGRDSRYWDRDDRRRDDEYNEESADQNNIEAISVVSQGKKDIQKYKDNQMDEYKSKEGLTHVSAKLQEMGIVERNTAIKRDENPKSKKSSVAGQNKFKLYEAKFKESAKNEDGRRKYSPDDASSRKKMKNTPHKPEVLENSHADPIDLGDDEYDDSVEAESEFDEHDDQPSAKGGDKLGLLEKATGDSSQQFEVSDVDKTESVDDVGSRHQSTTSTSLGAKSSPKGRRKKHRLAGASCEMKFFNSSARVLEPLEDKKFTRFSLQYTETEEKPDGVQTWEPKFAGHQSLQEREHSFYAVDQKINCGFVKSKGFPSTGFDVAEDDMKFMSSCHIAVSSCIFGNSDNLRTPTKKVVSRISRKSVCFVMFVDENTLRTMSLEGQKPDSMGYIGFWKIIVVKNLPYEDMRRVGKIPKFLAHRLFSSARYSVWLDSKLRLQRDPILILEYFLFRKGYEYAISNHYDRHCVWEEVAQNKRLNKFNHTIIDQQFAFYQEDGLKKFDASDPNKLLPSNVPEGSFIVRAHTPMSNLFSCLWFNEVDRFTPRDQLSFAYTYLKMMRMNPGKTFYLNMFKDCERRSIAKLYRHRAENKRNLPLQAEG